MEDGVETEGARFARRFDRFAGVAFEGAAFGDDFARAFRALVFVAAFFAPVFDFARTILMKLARALSCAADGGFFDLAFFFFIHEGLLVRDLCRGNENEGAPEAQGGDVAEDWRGNAPHAAQR